MGSNALYRNNRDGTFSSIPNPPFAQTDGPGLLVAWADIDNDGRVDLIGAREGKPASIYFNQGNGTFTETPFDVLSPWNIALADYDRDGLLDLYCSSWSSTAGASLTNALYHNSGGGVFTRMSAKEVGPIVSVSTFGAAWVDYDDDGWVDLFTGLTPRRMFHNDGNGRFSPINNVVTRATGEALMGAWGDYDNDGRLDLCVAGWGGRTVLYRNLGNGQFEVACGLPTLIGYHGSVTWVDYDNDGFLDLFVTGIPNPSHLFRNNGDGTFTQVVTGSPVTDIPLGGGTSKTYSADEVASASGSWFDYDNDGFLDLYVPNANDAGTAKVANFLYHNNGNANGWLTVKLVGTTSNRDAVGAKVRAQAKYAGQVRWQRRDITGGDLFNGQQIYAHFGLGDATSVGIVRIEWPSGTVQELHDVKSNQFLTVTEPHRPRLTATLGADGGLLIHVTTVDDHRYRLESSIDLQAWTSIINFVGTSSAAEFVDPEARTGTRFYRVVSEE